MAENMIGQSYVQKLYVLAFSAGRRQEENDEQRAVTDGIAFRAKAGY
jgi:hypothetical protein